MLAEGAGIECGSGFRVCKVAICPHSAIDSIHEALSPSYDADGQPAADDFAVSRQVRLNAEPGLGAARVNAEAGNHFVEDQTCARSLGNLPNLLEELLGLKVRPAALHGFDQNGGKLMSLVFENLERPWTPIVQHQDVIHGALRHSRRHGARAGAG